MNVLVHFYSRLQVVESGFSNIGVFETMEGCRDPAELVDYVNVVGHDLLESIHVQTLLILKFDQEIACLIFKLF